MIPSICAQKGQRRGFAALDTGNFDESTPGTIQPDMTQLVATSLDPTMTVAPTPNTSACAESTTINLATPGMMAPANATGATAPRRIAAAGLLMRECHDTNSSAKSQILLGEIAM